MSYKLRLVNTQSLCKVLSLDETKYRETLARCEDNKELVDGAYKIIDKYQDELQAAGDYLVRHYYRLLAGLLEHAPTPLGKRHVAAVLHVLDNAEGGGEAIVKLAQTWAERMVFPAIGRPIVGHYIDKTPVPVNHATLRLKLRAKEEREFRTRLAHREKFRCAISRFNDPDYTEWCRYTKKKVPDGDEMLMLVALILPFDIPQDDEDPAKADALITLNLLRAWSGLDLIDEYLNSELNAIYMTCTEESFFKRMSLYLDKHAYPKEYHRYKAHLARPDLGWSLGQGKTSTDVKFKANGDIMIPSASFVIVHACISQALYHGGMFVLMKYQDDDGYDGDDGDEGDEGDDGDDGDESSSGSGEGDPGESSDDDDSD